MHLATLVFLLLLVIAIAGPLARLIRIPLPLLLIAAGAVLSLSGVRATFDPDTFLLLFIPPLLFADAFLMPLREFNEVRFVVLAMAIGLVLFSTIGGGYMIHSLLPNVSLAVAFALAAILSPTDAVSVGSMIDEERVPARFLRILQGEALLNDASGLVCFKFAAAAAMTGNFSLHTATWSFLLVALGGIVVGIALTFAFNLANRHLQRLGFDDPATQTTLLVLLPFASYLGAEHLGVSGILAAVAAGLYANQSRVFGRAQTLTRLRAASVWAMIVFVFNGMVFLQLGLQLPSIAETGAQVGAELGIPFWRMLMLMTLVTSGLLLLRLIWIWIALAVRLTFARVRHRQIAMPTLLGTFALTVAGVRGAVTLAGVLSLPIAEAGIPGFPDRNLLVTLATGVILVSLIGAALLLPPLTRRLPPDLAGASEEDEENDTARRALARVALETLETPAPANPETDPDLREEVRAALIAEYRRRLRILGEGGDEDATAGTKDGKGWHRDALARHRLESSMRLRALRAERTALAALRRRDTISDVTERGLLRELDLEESALINHSRALPRAVATTAGS